MKTRKEEKEKSPVVRALINNYS